MLNNDLQGQTDQSDREAIPGALSLLKEAWFLYRKRASIYLTIWAIPASFFVIWAVLLAFSAHLNGPGKALTVLLYIIFIPVLLIVPIWSQISLIFSIKDREEGIGVRESFRRGWRKILSYYWVYVLTFFIVAGGILLFIVPGIIFSIWFSLAAFVLVAENCKGMAALIQSREYVRGHWGGVLWRNFFIGFVMVAILLMVMAIFSVFPKGSEAAGYLVSWFFTPFAMVYSYLIYSHLRAEKGELQPEKIRKRKILYILTAVIGFLLIPVAAAVIWMSVNKINSETDTKQQNQVVQDKTYQNTVFGYEIKYPGNYNLEEVSIAPTPATEKSSAVVFADTSVSIDVLSLTKEESSNSLDDFIRNYLKGYTAIVPLDLPGSLDGVWLFFKDGSMQVKSYGSAFENAQVVLVKKGENFMIITWSDLSDPGDQELFAKVIASLSELKNQSVNQSTEPIAPSEQRSEQTEDPEIVFADKLSSCTKYKTTFKHPLTGDTLEKEVLGLVNGKCNYVEQMPNGGKMECKYSESERITVAQYYKDLAGAESFETKLNVSGGKEHATYVINGKVVDNPLQETISSGTCVISGY